MGVWRHDKLSISRSFVPFFHDSKPPSVAVNTAAQNKRLPAFLWPMVGRWPYEQTNEISVNEFWEATSITLVGICGTCATTDSTNHRPCSTVCVCSVTQPCPALCHPMNCSPPGFSIHRISQARILEWVAISFPMCTIVFTIEKYSSVRGLCAVQMCAIQTCTARVCMYQSINSVA